VAGTLVKAHAYGNDFLILEASRPADMPADPRDFARRVCERHRGFGADGLLIAEPTSAGARMRLLNADGSDSEVSGNGLRCLAAWIARGRKLAAGGTLVIETDAGPKPLKLLEHDARRYTFVADMGAPTELRQTVLAVDGHETPVVVMRVGNPQCVVLGPATVERLHEIAAPLAVHPHFPAGTNVELAEVRGPHEVRILIWERGVGPTESSGTGTCAAAVAAAAFGGASRSLDVAAPGGRQHVEWTDDGLLLTGWAELIGSAEWWGA
jgi:diaminopimelate epimerase